MKLLKDLNIKSGTRALLRVDFNVEVKNGKVVDDFRLRAVLPTVEYLRDKGAQVILMSHMGRPDGTQDGELSLEPVSKHFSKLVGAPVKFFKKPSVPQMQPGEIAMLDNLRFNKAEEKGSKRFAKKLAKLGDVYINDAFGVSHRKNTSVYLLPKLLPHAAGLLLEKEVKILDGVRGAEKHPVVFILGGAKVKTKLKTLIKLFDKLDSACLGGLMANTLLHYQGFEVGKSLVERDMASQMQKLDLESHKIELPLDAVVSKDMSGSAPTRLTAVGKVEEDEIILDVGPDTIELFTKIIVDAKTVVWNGPLGLIETKKFRKGTEDLARALKKSKADVIVGGGDVMGVINDVSASKHIKHQSTGGGAMLEYLADGTLPAIEVLK